MSDLRTAHAPPNGSTSWGVLAQFTGPDDLVRAIQRLRQENYASLEAYTPFPNAEVIDQMSFKRSPMPLIILVGGVVGGASIYALMYWINLHAYPINIGGRPLHSWPAFIPPTFECTVLVASFSAIIGMMVMCRLPRLHHPLFEIEAFKRASTDGFFIVVRADDGRYDVDRLRTLMSEIGAMQTWEVPDV